MTEPQESYGFFRATEHRIRTRIVSLPRSVKQTLMLATDAVGIFASVWASAWLLFPGALNYFELILIGGSTVVVALSLQAQQGLYHSIIRYVGIDLAIAATKVTLISATVLAVVTASFSFAAQPVRFAIIYAALCLLYLVGSRYSARSLLNRRNRGRERVIVYGAGEAGARLALSMQDGDSFLPVAFVDDKKGLVGKRVGGLSVYTRDNFASLIEQFDVSRILLALPSASRRRRLAIISALEKLNVHVQTIPDLNDLVTGKARVDDIRDVDVADLLGRDSVPPDKTLLTSCVTGKNVMVTGAGGSIGSELCRQVLKLEPKTLLLFELSEVALYNIEKELRNLMQTNKVDCEVVALLGSVHHQDRVREILQTFNVHTVYHAAAYKHVPLVERNILEGIHNNIFGTLHTALAAVDAGVSTFVLVSTDKAVSPTNIMGATKRFAELVLQALEDEYEDTCFCIVRFGNVLESSGSVVPLFREQIRAGGPVTVTHRDIIRYFMTIPEAAQLVIQAGAMARGGDVFVLDMGKPVKIQDLARRMIHLMGLTVRDDDHPDGDIEVEFTGLRPAEKLYEELLIGRDVSGTNHPRILRANEEYIPIEELKPLIAVLRNCCQELDRDGVRKALLASVNGYNPTNGIDDLVWRKNQESGSDKDSSKIVKLPQRSA